jgi:NTP pyrophosphatase (non-canonical NTP hydrolase)
MTEQKKRYFKAAQGFVAGIDWIELDKGDVIAQLDNGERSLCTSITEEQVQERVDSGEWREYDYPPAGDLNVLAAQIEQWGADKGILEKSDPYKQFEKLLEEVEETRVAIEESDQDGIEDGIGDCFVVLTLLARLCGTDIEHCVRSAYNEIKSRKGVMVDGKFQKFDIEENGEVWSQAKQS